MNYDFGRLGITEVNKQEYINLLELQQKYFVPAKYSQMDKVSIEIEYDIEGLITYEQLSDTNQIFILQAMMGLTTLAKESSEMFKVDLTPDNLYFDQGANAYQLVRELSTKQYDEEELVLEIKSLLGNHFLKDDYASIHAANGKLLGKSKLLGKLVDVTDLDTLNTTLASIINEMLKVERTSKVTVNKNYVNKLKRIGRFKSLVIVILLVATIYLLAVFIPNRTSQLHAVDSYQAGKYEEVLANLNETNIKVMSPVIKYLMASSTINLSQLSDNQKDNIQYNLSPTVAENTLDFWVYIGQGKLESAYDQSIKNNDAQQKAYVLLLLIDQTQNDTSLKTEEKESKLSTYQGELDAITSSMEEDKAKE